MAANIMLVALLMADNENIFSVYIVYMCGNLQNRIRIEFA